MKNFVAILLCFVWVSSAISSAEDASPLAKTLLSKSYDIQNAFLQREEDYQNYLLNIKTYLDHGGDVLDLQDPLHVCVYEEVEGTSGGRERMRNWISASLAACQNNLTSQNVILKLIQSATNVDRVKYVAGKFHELNESYIANRLMATRQGIIIPSTRPGKIETHNPINRHVAQIAIDRHASYVEMIKDAYMQLLQLDPKEAVKYIETLGPGRLVTQYVIGESDAIPDPGTRLVTDYMPVIAMPLDRVAGPNPDNNKPCLTRKERRQAQRKLQKDAKKHPAQPSSHKATQSSVSAHVQERIRRAVARKRELSAQKDADRALKRQRAKEAREAFEELRAQYVNAQPQVSMSEDVISASSSTQWTTPAPRVRIKTRGLAGHGFEAQEAQVSSSSTSSHSSSAAPHTSDQEAAPGGLTTAVIKRLETFWETKAGLTYHEVASLFTTLGGRISEKRGGSSHVTLSYFKGDGTKLKHELWRPHGSGNTFGFRTMAGLQAYFERCGLTLKDE